jgi:hypothetical protein
MNEIPCYENVGGWRQKFDYGLGIQLHEIPSDLDAYSIELHSMLDYVDALEVAVSYAAPPCSWEAEWGAVFALL